MYSRENTGTDNFLDISVNMEGLQINFILQTGFFDTENHWTVSSHFHSCYEFHFVLDGKIELVAEDKTYCLEKDTICLIPPSVSHYTNRMFQPAKKVSLLLHLSSRKAGAETQGCEYQFYSNLYSQIQQVNVIRSGDLYQKYLKPINDLFHTNEIWCSHKIKALFTLFFIEVSEKIINETALSIGHDTDCTLSKAYEETNQWENTKMMAIESYINKNYSKDITLRDMADCLHLSEKQTDRTLRKLTNLGFRELLLKRRMERARELIIHSSIPINEIAAQIGYNSYNGFYIAFKNTFGASPKSLRNSVEHKNKGNHRNP